MFVHAEPIPELDPSLKDGDLTCFIRMGSDLRNNYYEYEIPLILTPQGIYNNNSEADREVVWPKENMFDFPLKALTAAKIARNRAKRAGTEGVSNTVPYVVYDDENDKPQNKITVLYAIVRTTPFRDLQQTSTALEGLNDMEGGLDFEKVESARLLTSSEYTLNSALGYISLKAALNQDEVLAVAYEYTYNGQVYQVGEFSTDGSEELRAPNALALKMLKSSANAPGLKNRGTWDLMMKNIYSLGATSINEDKFELYVTYRNDSVGTDMQYLNEGL